MFSELKTKVSKEQSKRKPSDTHSLTPSISANSRTNSNESLVSLTSATGSTYRKSDRLKHLESKLTELGSLLRQKNASLEAAQKNIDRLTVELKKNQEDSQQYINSLNVNSADEIKMNEEERSILSAKLVQAEADLDKINKLSEVVLEQKNQELLNLKGNLSKSEEEIRQLQTELVNKTGELERLSRQLTQSTKELEVTTEALENTKAARTKLQDEQATQAEVLRLLRCDNEAAEATIKELNSTMDQLRASLRQQERLTVEEADRAGNARAEVEKIKARMTSVEVRAADRESDMKDRIRLLEERLVLLTEPNDPLFADQLEEAKLSSSTTLPDDASQPGAAAARCITLLVERKLLENRLKDTRAHLEDVKSNWNQKFTSLESQISHLNGKIIEDSNDHEKARLEWEESRQQMESQLTLAREACAEAEAKANRLETEASERERSSSQQDENWQFEKATLTAQIAALQQAAESETKTHSESIQLSHELQSRLSASETSLNAALKEMEVKTTEIATVKAELDKKSNEIASLYAAGDAHRSSISQLEDKIKQLDEKCQALNSSNEKLNSKKTGAESETEALRQEMVQLKSDYDMANRQLTEARQVLTTTAESLQKAEANNSILLAKIEAMETAQATCTKESSEMILLKENIETLNETITERNKTIRLQKQKLAELKKAFGQGLRSNAPCSSSTTLNEEDQTNEAYSNGGVTGLLEVSIPPMTNHQPNPVRGPRENAPFSFAPPPPPLSSNYPPSNPKTVAQLPVGNMAFSLTNSQSDTDHVNFDYLRHIVLKFLLSRESEALKLVRVLVTILRFSKEDEFLIRQTLESRKSWFNAPVVSPKSSGQFAKVVSPPF